MALEKDVRMSLAGAQNKYPIYLKEGKYYQPLGNSPSSHIIKHPNAKFPFSVINEFFCMRLAKSLGLKVPKSFRARLSDDFEIYVIERYDRYANASGSMMRIHQEDFCQILGIGSALKYESSHHPFKIKDVFTFILKHSRHVVEDRTQLAMWILFNYFIGNRDNHFKNLSVLYTENGIELAPFMICYAQPFILN